MNRNLLWRGVLIGAVVAIALVLALPLKDKINLGLDLKGGMHLVLQVQTQDAVRAEVESEMGRLIRQAEEEKITGLAGRRVGDNAFEITGAQEGTRDKVLDIANRFLPTFSRRSGAPGLVFEMKPEVVQQTRQLAVQQAKRTITNRIDQFGVAEPVVQEASGYRILVQLPGIDDQERVRRLIKNTAFLEFRLVRFPAGGGSAPTREAILANYNNQLPPELEILEGDARDNVTQQITGKVYYGVEKKRVITGRDLKSARPGQGQFNEPVVNFNLSPASAKTFGEITGSNINTGLAIVLDGRVVSAPVIHAKITDSGVIEGNFSQQEAEDLSTVLRSGALPAGITYLEERTVGPALGRDSIEEGIRAGIVGTALVVAAMLIIYSLSGLNAVVALMLNIVLLFGGMGMFHSTLTLPGIAGIILTIGMAVDANVLIFERIREEMHAGRSIRSAIDLGFERAFSSIFDGHVTTLISAVFLFQFGTGPIKGFAVTLFIGLIASLFTSVFVSRWMFDLILHYRRVQKLSI
jgi:preprotein translocase subunit SecD